MFINLMLRKNIRKLANHCVVTLVHLVICKNYVHFRITPCTLNEKKKKKSYSANSQNKSIILLKS